MLFSPFDKQKNGDRVTIKVLNSTLTKIMPRGAEDGDSHPGLAHVGVSGAQKVYSGCDGWGCFRERAAFELSPLKLGNVFFEY